ncbi:hypothetical protein Q3G72_018961 [Acer saccharum]|nr:hypothetical protein Q3G72_018961 [Acer saccharum]
MDEKDSILGSIPADLKEKGSTLYASLIDGKGGLQTLIKYIKEQDLDKVSVGLASSLDTIAELSASMEKQLLAIPDDENAKDDRKREGDWRKFLRKRLVMTGTPEATRGESCDASTAARRQETNG